MCVLEPVRPLCVYLPCATRAALPSLQALAKRAAEFQHQRGSSRKLLRTACMEAHHCQGPSLHHATSPALFNMQSSSKPLCALAGQEGKTAYQLSVVRGPHSRLQQWCSYRPQSLWAALGAPMRAPSVVVGELPDPKYRSVLPPTCLAAWHTAYCSAS